MLSKINISSLILPREYHPQICPDDPYHPAQHLIQIG